jgi:hypothetical protein
MNDNKITKVNVPKIYIKNKSNEKNNNKHFSNKKINYKEINDINRTRKNKQNFNLLKIKKISRLLNIASNYWLKFFN